ncbi:MAG TPA: DUF1573 domain-containing protein [Flavobacteriales bacterium]|nr:DUF1573 domain-containing protein [Flavobacteriales bacterium]
MKRHLILPIVFAIVGTTHAQTDPVPPSGAVITFETTEHDYGTVEQASNGTCTFNFTNTGKEPLIISNCQSSCGCMVARCDRDPVLPGKSGVVEVKYDTQRVGPFTKNVTVVSNAVNAPTVALRIKGTVIPKAIEARPAATTGSEVR